METKLVGEIDATHDQYKQLREKEDEHRMKMAAMRQDWTRPMKALSLQ